jgi:hypothetical protein
MRSSSRINLLFVRLRLALPDSAAGAFFLGFGVFTLVLQVIRIRAKPPNCSDQREIVAIFILQSEAFMLRIISPIAKQRLPVKRILSSIIMLTGLRFRPMVLYFWPGKSAFRLVDDAVVPVYDAVKHTRSLADTKSQLHPALWRLSAMISQSFTGRLRLPIVQNRLRCGFVHFKLCAHFLDLCCLFFYGCS